ncbi:hypothetical protein C3F09_09750 [candidate division GN15 bacterium]|uniref:FlgD Ig-like domain-containing protein n=1 Tax=candidate division GN15 bacterium TaxID=2072418 RepID=A0A855X3Y5_9BACT|nr:MAG: hypothetical protein C3F09_09750 [candidate division GN15 bacterium]
MRNAVIAILLLVSLPCFVRAVAPDTLWTRTFGGASFEWAWHVEETSDHGYVITGYTGSTAHGDRDIYIVKLNQDGSFAWDKTYGQENCADEARSAKETSDGGLIVGGYGSGQFGAESANLYLMKLDASGNFLWDEDYDYDTTTDYGFDVCQTLDGGYIMVGTSYYWSTTQGQYDWGFDVVRTDANGVKQNHLLVDKWGSQDLNRVIPTADSGAIAIGTAGAIYIVKINKYGDTTWIKGYGGVGAGWSILQLADGGYMAFGDRDFGSPYDEDFWLLRLNANGDTLWSRRYRNPAPDLGYGLDQCSDGGFVMCGEMYRNAGVDPTDFYIIRTSANGDTLWTKTIGGDQYERSYCVKQTSDGGFIVVGRTNSYGAGDDDFYIVKLAPESPADVATESESLPLTCFLGANYPNPFNPLTTFRYSLPRRGDAIIEVFNITGRKVRTLVDAIKPAGSYVVEWNGCDDDGRPVSSGMYLYRLISGDFVQTRKMMLLK